MLNSINSELEPELEPELESGPDLIDSDMNFPKAMKNSKMSILQSKVTAYVSELILLHEIKFYNLVHKNFPKKKPEILGTTCKTIIDMISEANSSHFNRLYSDCQNNKFTPEVMLIHSMTEYGAYGPHALLDKLVRITLDIHTDIVREDLCLDDLDQYKQTIQDQINDYLLNSTLLYILEKDQTDTTNFISVPPNTKPFQINLDIVYEKPINFT